MKLKPIALYTLQALTEQRIGWRARNLSPQFTAREGIILGATK